MSSVGSVDVIVPCYRYGHFLRQCVESVLAQSVPNVRVLIIDDASPDNTSEVAADLAREDSRVIFLRHTANRGHIATYNEGIEWASGDYTLILSADDYLLPGALTRSASLMDAYPEVGFTFGKAITFDDRGERGQKDSARDKADWRILAGPEFIELSGSHNIVATPTAVVRTELQKQVGGYRRELPHSGDMEMWLRLAAHASVGALGACQAVYRRHAGNMSLMYTAQGLLTDLQQRKAALDCFFRTCGHALPNAQLLHRRFFWSLGCDAVGLASSAFNEHAMEVSEQLSEFALRVCPRVKRSLPWTKLACKRSIGYGAWHALQSAVDGIRLLALPLKRLAKLVYGSWPSQVHRSPDTLPAQVGHAGDRFNTAGLARMQELSGSDAAYGTSGNEMQKRGRVNDCGVEHSDHPKLLIASRLFGASGQPWLWRQVVGLSGFRKELLCWERQNPLTQPAGDVSVQVLPGDPAPYDSSGRWWFRLRNLWGRNFYAAIGRERRQLATLLRRQRPAVILCNFGDIAMRLLPVAWREGIPVVAYFHGHFGFLNNRWYRWSLSRCLRRFSAIVVLTKAERRWMLDHGVPEDKLHVIPCGAPTEMFRPGTRNLGRTVRFVMVSRLVGQKGCDLSIKAFARLASDVTDAELHIYGDGPARNDLQHLVGALGLKAKVFFHGYVEEREMAEALPSYEVFIQHSLQNEGFPVSIAEAMACGLPVVATPVGGIIEQVVEEKTGLLVEERDVGGMAAAMRRLACDPQLRRSLGQAGRDRAVNQYDSSLQTRRLEQVLLGVTGNAASNVQAKRRTRPHHPCDR
jgi:glycosyltransferase involved in cell wall biosynthesis